MIFQILICLILGYAFGLIQTGYLYGKIVKGIDIREYGSHSAGATNTVRTLGKGAGYFVFLGDGLKMTAAVCLVRFFLFSGQGRLTGILVMVTAIGVILGHDFPFYLGFKGGKSVSTGLGVLMMLMPKVAFIVFLVWLAVVFVTQYVSLGSIIGAALVPVLAYIFSMPMEYFVFGVLAAVFIIYRHKANIDRLLHGRENKIKSAR